MLQWFVALTERQKVGSRFNLVEGIGIVLRGNQYVVTLINIQYSDLDHNEPFDTLLIRILLMEDIHVVERYSQLLKLYEKRTGIST